MKAIVLAGERFREVWIAFPVGPQITVIQDGQEIEVDSRPSDAIALAIRAEAPIFAADDVIAESAIEFEGEEIDEAQLEDEVMKFRSFLEDVTPDQFVVENGDEED